MKRRAIPYLLEELAWIEVRKDMPRRELHALFCTYWQRDDVSLANFKALCKRHGFMTGRTGCFEAGLVPFNKGRKMPFSENSARTRFKKGAVPPNRRPMFSERVGKDGYVEMKVPLPNPFTTAKTRFMHKHRYLWEEVNGPLPAGMRLKCLDGDRTNCDPSNWEAIPHGLAPRLNGRFGRSYDKAPAELRPTIMLAAKLEHAAREAKRKGSRHD